METPPDLYVVIFLGRFLSILYEAMPFIVLGAVIAGFLEELVPQHLVSKFIPRNHVLAIGLSALLGLIFPMCECGIVPVMRRLLRKGLPLSCCVAYMLAGPIINVVVISSTFVAFARHEYGYWIVGLRVFLGFLVAVGSALIVHVQYRKYGDTLLHRVSAPSPIHAEVDEEVHEEEAHRPLIQRLGNITETALHDFVDITLFLILGALLAAGVGLFISRNDMERLSSTYPVLAILAMMAMAVLLCLCSEADAFVAASFTALHPAAKLAFLVLGPMLDLKLFMMYTRVFRFRLIWTIITAVVVQVLIWSLLCYYAFEAGIPARVDSFFAPAHQSTSPE